MKKLIELLSTDCRWPIDEFEGEHLFCSRPRCDGSSYCKAHHDRSLKRNENGSVEVRSRG